MAFVEDVFHAERAMELEREAWRLQQRGRMREGLTTVLNAQALAQESYVTPGPYKKVY